MATLVAKPPAATWNRWYLGVVGSLVIAYYFLTAQPQLIVYNGIAVGTAVVMLVGVVLSRPQPSFAWTLLGFGILLMAAGELLYGLSQPVPSPADVAYVSAYPLLALGLVGLGRSLKPVRKRAMTGNSLAVDIVLVVGGIAVTAIVFLLIPAGKDGSDWTAQAVSLGYPVMDVGLLAVWARVARRDAARRTPLLMIGAALALMLLADVAYALEGFGTTYSLGDPVDGAWLLSYALMGAALLHPSLVPPKPKAPTKFRTMPAGWVPPAPLRAPEPPPAPATPTITQTQTLRFRVVLTWAGLALLVLGGMGLLLSATWNAPDMVMLAAAFGGMGSVIALSSAVR